MMLDLEPTSYKILIEMLKAISWQSLVIFNRYILSRKHAYANVNKKGL